MDRSEIKQMEQPIGAKVYYVEDALGRWAFITIAPEVGMVQIHSDYGSFSHRYDAFRGDFREFLTRAEGIRDKFEGWWHGWNFGAGRQLTQRMRGQLRTIMANLWPLLVEKLKAELETAARPEEE